MQQLDIYVLQHKIRNCNIDILYRFYLYRANYLYADLLLKAFKEIRCGDYIHCSNI